MVTAVKIVRILNGDTQAYMADFIGCARTTYVEKENGKIPFTLDESDKIASKYNISLKMIANSDLAREKIIESLQT